MKRLRNDDGSATAEYAIATIPPRVRASRLSTSASRTCQARPDETPRQRPLPRSTSPKGHPERNT